MKRLIEQTLCEHGSDGICTEVTSHRHLADGVQIETRACPGGSSREVTVEFWENVYDYMVKEFSIDDMLDREMFQVHTYDLERAALAGGR